jgi:hypothetical protein
MAVVIAVCSAGCHGDGIGLTPSGDLLAPGEDPQVGGFAVDVQPIFDRRCIQCHSPGLVGFTATGGTQGGLDLTRRASYQSLVDRPTFERPDTPPLVRVRPGDIADSYIVQKISSESPKAGRRMPLSGPPYLNDAEIQAIEDWIRRGAPND